MAIMEAQRLDGLADGVPAGVEPRLALAGALLCAGAVGLATAGAPGDASFGRGLLELLIVGVPIAAGLYALRAPVKGGERSRSARERRPRPSNDVPLVVRR